MLSGGEWIQATPIPETILVNMGELMQIWTSDHYVATVGIPVFPCYGDFILLQSNLVVLDLC